MASSFSQADIENFLNRESIIEGTAAYELFEKLLLLSNAVFAEVFERLVADTLTMSDVLTVQVINDANILSLISNKSPSKVQYNALLAAQKERYTKGVFYTTYFLPFTKYTIAKNQESKALLLDTLINGYVSLGDTLKYKKYVTMLLAYKKKIKTDVHYLSCTAALSSNAAKLGTLSSNDWYTQLMSDVTEKLVFLSNLSKEYAHLSVASPIGYTGRLLHTELYKYNMHAFNSLISKICMYIVDTHTGTSAPNFNTYARTYYTTNRNALRTAFLKDFSLVDEVFAMEALLPAYASFTGDATYVNNLYTVLQNIFALALRIEELTREVIDGK